MKGMKTFAISLASILLLSTIPSPSFGEGRTPPPLRPVPGGPARPVRPPKFQPGKPVIKPKAASEVTTASSLSENASSQAALSEELSKIPLLAKMAQASPDRYRFAVEKGASFHADPDGKSFYISWFPKNVQAGGNTPVLVTLHGHGSYAFDEFYLWQPFLEKRGYGIVALQWWFGGGETPKDYYMPNELYRNIDGIFKEMGVRSGRAVLHGFSRGSANSYGVKAFDATKGKRYFILTIANAGRPGPDFPANAEIDKGAFGKRPFAGTYWVTFAGAKDPNPERDGIAGMRYAKEWIEKHGGEVYLAIEDDEGDHGGFHRNKKNVDAALDVFAKLLMGMR